MEKLESRFRCDCPFTSAIDVLGDRWILVIVKQMLIEGSETFKDFTESKEAIATNILSSKLKLLEEIGIIVKTKRPENKKTNFYWLTEKGLALTPLLIELAIWSDTQLRALHPSILDGDGLKQIRKDKNAFATSLVTNYQKRIENVSSSSHKSQLQ